MENYSNEVWVFVEQRSGKAVDIGFELLSKGRKLAESLNGDLKAIVIGHKTDDICKETFKKRKNYRGCSDACR